ncbi:MAG TPA: ABC transporter ATP-binding protein [Cyclobacteriaceae bacterium]|nr:ABC transporter ATP-binding protein [Cyclobacteriaceae bacterium]
MQNLSKRFTIRHQSASYLTFRELLTGGFKLNKTSEEEFWALKDINYSVFPGDSVGIIGRNGAGKTTLLKILSKITPPSMGKILARGRVASLLEVGTGFHPELTGRENVYLNGSILGMKKREIDQKFDEIIAFAGTERFLDTALKHYSTGMELRLAFSVAAFLEPEILVIDEVLAVGDAEFQKKCLGKMEAVSRSGRTILFVSHNMEAVRSLCNKALLLEKGSIQCAGETESVIQEYFKNLSSDQRMEYRPVTPIQGKGMSLRACSVTTDSGNAFILNNGHQLAFHFELINSGKRKFSTYLFVYHDETLAFIASDLHDPCTDKIASEQEEFRLNFIVPPYLLGPGRCRVGLMIADYNGNTEQYFNNMDLLNFMVEEDGVRRGNRYNLDWPGTVSPLLKVYPG